MQTTTFLSPRGISSKFATMDRISMIENECPVPPTTHKTTKRTEKDQATYSASPYLQKQASKRASRKLSQRSETYPFNSPTPCFSSLPVSLPFPFPFPGASLIPGTRLGPLTLFLLTPVSGSTTLPALLAACTSSGFSSRSLANVDSASQFHQELVAKRRSISSRVRWLDSG